MHTIYRLLIVLVFLFFFTETKSQNITDTIFFNKSWEICEKEIAAYYRIGTLTIDSFWYYTGINRDYDLNHQLMTEIHYTKEGYKQGPFSHYYQNGKLYVKGQFKNNEPTGNWQWYYPDGKEHAIINFDAGADNFQFIKYVNERGNVTLQNGNGDFEWRFSLKNEPAFRYELKGQYTYGKRDGKWKFYSIKLDNSTNLTITEKYDDGIYKKSIRQVYSNTETIHNKVNNYEFAPVKIWITEQIRYDNFFRKNGKENSDLAVIRYLFNRTNSEIIVKNKKFEEALVFMLTSLESNRHRLDFHNKEINGYIKFKVGDNGYPENITIGGEGISEKEKEFLIFYMSKFKNIEMPIVESVAFESYHTIYLYSINVKDFVPISIRHEVDKELFFSTLKRDAFKAILESRKKQIKKFIRSQFTYYW
jgi:antitoxin component YwqK of YwqJK toxin-antitoxin module